jgi:hypothetical protein
MRPPVEEIDGYLEQGYRQSDIEQIMMRRYGRGFRAEIRKRAKLVRSSSPAPSPASKDASSPAANEAANSPENVANF